MPSQYRDLPHTIAQPHARQVGQNLHERREPQTITSEQRAGIDVNELIERVYWLMLRDPLRDQRRHM
jgi:hypothetical protein